MNPCSGLTFSSEKKSSSLGLQGHILLHDVAGFRRSNQSFAPAAPIAACFHLFLPAAHDRQGRRISSLLPVCYRGDARFFVFRRGFHAQAAAGGAFPMLAFRQVVLDADSLR